MHDGMPYGPIQGQGQGHMALKVRNSSIFQSGSQEEMTVRQSGMGLMLFVIWSSDERASVSFICVCRFTGCSAAAAATTQSNAVSCEKYTLADILETTQNSYELGNVSKCALAWKLCTESKCSQKTVCKFPERLEWIFPNFSVEISHLTTLHMLYGWHRVDVYCWLKVTSML